jgi:signal transduction histidine kinase
VVSQPVMKMGEKTDQHWLRLRQLISSVGVVPWLFLILLCAACYLYYATQMSFWRVQMEASEVQTVGLTVQRLGAGLRPAVSDLLILSENSEVLSYLAHPRDTERKAMELDLLRWCRRKTDYFEIRLLDVKGLEIARVNYNHGVPTVVPMDELRDVSERPYFVRTLALDRQEVFVSPFELNVEAGKVEQPPHPAILFSTPLFDQEGYKRGVLIFSYEGQRILDKIEAATGGSELMLLNADGYWLKGPNPRDEWGFMDEEKKDKTFAKSSPDAWEKITAAETGKFYNKDGFYAFSTLFPLATADRYVYDKVMREVSSQSSIPPYEWKIVSKIPNGIIRAKEGSVLLQAGLLGALGLSILTLFTALQARTRMYRRRSEEQRAAQELLEKQLRQAQKMEAIGKLSGGIAHDFNNLLNVIIGYSEDLQDRLAPDDPVCKNVAEIKKAGERAASLTRQLLAFSRQQVLAPRILDLNAVVLEVEKMLRRLIGEHIELRTALDPALGRTRADQGQIEQVIVNLAVNARDAMPNGGRLTIETANIDLDEGFARTHNPQMPGAYVLLTVSDTGIGMDPQTQARIFEPFFTTKELGKGTGLGLSTVYGVVRQSDGHIWVYSEPGQGSTFKIYLPRTGDAVPAAKPLAGPSTSLRGTETILLVEDENALRELVHTLLTDSGYTVLQADHPDRAIDIARTHNGPIQVLLTDAVMPGMNGRALAEQLARVRPEMKVLYMSGYTGFTHPGVLDPEMTVLQKPFTREAMLRKLREVLDLQKEPTVT